MIDIKEQIWLMAYKCRIFKAIDLTFHGNYTHLCEVSKVFAINTENKMSAKQVTCKWSLKIKNKYGCQMQNTYAKY